MSIEAESARRAAASAAEAESTEGGVAKFEKEFNQGLSDLKDKFDGIFTKAEKGMQSEPDHDAKHEIYANALAEMRSYSIEFSGKMVKAKRSMGDSEKSDAMEKIRELSGNLRGYIDTLDNALLENF